jgi:hypothetical protein
MANGQPTENGLPQRASTTNPDWNSYIPRGEGRTDEQIRADIHQKLAQESGEHTRGLSIEVAGGTVTLRGGASTAAERQRIVALVRSVPSVRDVYDQMSASESGSSESGSSGSGRVEQLTRGYEAVRERALDGAHAMQSAAADWGARTQDYALRVGSRAQDYARRTGMQTTRSARDVGDFVSTHALPLALVSASLAYLAWSVRREHGVRASGRGSERPVTDYPARYDDRSQRYVP